MVAPYRERDLHEKKALTVARILRHNSVPPFFSPSFPFVVTDEMSLLQAAASLYSVSPAQ
jgi:hypothetical protein